MDYLFRPENDGFLYIGGGLTRLDRLEEYLQATRRRRPIFVTGPFDIGKTDFVARGLEFSRPPNTEVEWIKLNDSSSQNLAGILYKIQSRKDKRRRFVVVDNAELLPDEALEMLVNRLLNLKAVANVILISTRPVPPRAGANIIDFWPPEGKLYGLKDQLLKPQRSIIPVIAPQVVTLNNLLIQRLKKQPTDLFAISPRQFEEVIADLLIGMGMEVELTPATRDGGKDILVYMQTEIGTFLTLVEAKQHNERRPVGVGLVRSLFGTLMDHQATSAMLVTTSHFAKPAQQFQQRHRYQLELKNYSHVVSWLMRHKA